MKRLIVDFNMRGPNGTVRASTRALADTPHVGELVVCTDPGEEDMTYLAEVSEVRDGGVVLLAVDWSSSVGNYEQGGRSGQYAQRLLPAIGVDTRIEYYRVQQVSGVTSHLSPAVAVNRSSSQVTGELVGA